MEPGDECNFLSFLWSPSTNEDDWDASWKELHQQIQKLLPTNHLEIQLQDEDEVDIANAQDLKELYEKAESDDQIVIEVRCYDLEV